MYKICVFGGTTEGRELVEFLNAQPCEVTACVATEYGQALLPEAEGQRDGALGAYPGGRDHSNALRHEI